MSRSILIVHAHPDDECLTTGATIAKYSSEGAEVCLVTCTGGENGEIHTEPGGETAEEIFPRLREVREAELREACDHLGVTDLRLLGYRDSGMAGTEENARTDAFVNIHIEEVVARLVAIIREVKPQVVVTYNAFGFYGHPDHIAAHRATVAAFDAAAHRAYMPTLGEPFAPSKLYYTALPMNRARALVEAREFSEVAREDEIELLNLATPDDEIGAAIASPEAVENVAKAIAAHRTQYGTTRRFLELPDEIRPLVFGENWFVRVRAPEGISGVESDLFNGV